MNRTEDGIPVRTLFIPNISVCVRIIDIFSFFFCFSVINIKLHFFSHLAQNFQITNKTLCDYFRQFGAIERVQILPERVRLYNLIGDNSNSVVNALNATEQKYFAYVTFVNCLAAHDALHQHKHEIQNHELIVEEAFSWHQPNIELLSYAEDKLKNDTTKMYNKYVFDAIDKHLDYDCIYEIMKYLTTYELSEMAKYNERFLDVAKNIRKFSIAKYSDWNSNSNSISLMDLRAFLRLQGFGETVTTLKLSMNIIKTSRSIICSRLINYLGPQLKSLSLLHFGLTTEQFEQFKPIFLRLRYLDVDLNYRFDYATLNDCWPNLHTLRIKSQGEIQLLDPTSEKPINFSNCKCLTIASSYKLHENNFQHIAQYFHNLTELAVIVIDDYYTELTRMSGLSDLQYIKELKYLEKLHLSLSRMYLTDAVIESFTELASVKDFTLEVNGTRSSSSDTIMDQLKGIVRGMPLLERFRISNVHVTDEKVLEIIKFAKNLRSLSIHNNSYALSIKMLNDIVNCLENKHLKNNIHGASTSSTSSSSSSFGRRKIFEIIVDSLKESKLLKVNCFKIRCLMLIFIDIFIFCFSDYKRR